jgi:4-hydroxymandelate oxidase
VAISGLPILVEAERRAQELLPAGVWDYYAGGSGCEVTLDDAVAAWQRHRLLPHVLRNVAMVSTSTTVLGTPVASPVLLAPTASTVMAHPEGEVAAARGTAAAGGLMIVSSRCSTRIEAIAAAAAGPWWFQVYVMRDRRLTEGLVLRAAAAGATALVLTGDTPYTGVKHRVLGELPLTDEQALVNLSDHLEPGADGWHDMDQDPATTLDDIGWLREMSGLPVLVKGVLRADDALACLAAGAAGVVVSNHGGRQLDRSLSSAEALAGIAAAVGDRGEVYVDGGIRDGISVLTALALGARAVLIGRPAIWALAAGGADGVTRLLAALQTDLADALALVGVSSPQDLDCSLVAAVHEAGPVGS